MHTLRLARGSHCAYIRDMEALPSWFRILANFRSSWAFEILYSPVKRVRSVHIAGRYRH